METKVNPSAQSAVTGFVEPDEPVDPLPPATTGKIHEVPVQVHLIAAQFSCCDGGVPMAAAPVVGAQKDPFHAVFGPQDEAPG
ncbi:unannotated protein [freshwater metagenome]|uniref:Unannotated protein n=1 Tax=freshwater metagenome TaxID=449393 RepID=A0A6J7S3E5_9ZZZZ|nr:hypothetical protein [Actinomycetota bacterium]